MKSIKERFEEIKSSKNPEVINDFLIEMGKNPKKEYLDFLNFFIENFKPQIIKHIKINLVYVLGEIGKLETLDNKFIDYLYEEFYNSDMWVRNEIIRAFKKISKKEKLPDNVIELIGNALIEDYLAIKKNALKVLLNVEDFPNIVIRNIFQILDLHDTKIIEYSTEVLQKYVKNEKQLCDLLDQSENYKILSKKAVRSLLLICFNSIIYLNSFREVISSSQWENKNKDMFLNEIDTYERILLKNQ